MSLRSRTVLLAGIAACSLPATLLAAALTGPRIIDSSRPDQAPPPTPTGGATPAVPAAPAPPPNIQNQSFVLHDVTVDGAKFLPAADVAATWQKFQGKTVKVADVYAIADAVAALYKQHGLALFAVTVPGQDFATGHVHILAIEGYVQSVTIGGDTKGADLSLLKAYAGRIVSARPLTQTILERYILLMSDIPGLTVGSAFKPVPNSNGGEVLALTIQRKTYTPAAAIDNQGAVNLSQVQGNVSMGVNSVIQEGDRTQAVFGFPVTWDRYQYYGLSHQTPIGSDGATLGLSVGELVTRRTKYIDSGNAFVQSTQVNYPLIRSATESLILTGSFDVLNSNSALFGTSITDERTRSLRLGAAYAVVDGLGGIDRVAIVGSTGLDIFGARRGSIVYGGPNYNKLTLRVARDQPLPLNLVFRMRAMGQLSPTHTPSSEQFTYGGMEYGQAFNAATLNGDEGLAAAMEIAYKLPPSVTFGTFDGSEIYAEADWGEMWNLPSPYQYPTDRAASAAFGVRLNIFNKLGLNLAAATPLIQPTTVQKADRWRFVFGITGGF